LGNEAVWCDFRGTSQLLAEITPWRTEGQDAAIAMVSFKHTLAPIITDLRNIRGVVGRVRSQGRWGIVDRMGLTRVSFLEQEDGESDGCDDND
jgi:hypothetical protein